MTAAPLMTALVQCALVVTLARGRALPLGWNGIPTIAAALAGAAIGALLYHALRLYPNARSVPRNASAASIAGALVAAVCEELLFRGYGLNACSALYGGVAAVAIVTAAFAVMHAYQGWFAVGVHVLTGSAFTAALLLTHDLSAAIAAHLAYNLLAARTMIVRSPLPLVRIPS